MFSRYSIVVAVAMVVAAGVRCRLGRRRFVARGRGAHWILLRDASCARAFGGHLPIVRALREKVVSLQVPEESCLPDL